MLAGRRILICEDEFSIADLLEDGLSAEGAQILGPVATVEDAMALLWAGAHLDAAVLDVNLHGELSFPIAEKLLHFRIPFLLCTGFSQLVVPDRLSHVPVLLKPVGARAIVLELEALLAGVEAPPQ